MSAAIVFLLSPAAGFISGETLRVDGAAPNAKRHVALEPHDRSKPWNGFHRAVTAQAAAGGVMAFHVIPGFMPGIHLCRLRRRIGHGWIPGIKPRDDS